LAVSTNVRSTSAARIASTELSPPAAEVNSSLSASSNTATSDLLDSSGRRAVSAQ
jgi:hypothetical protein